MKQKLLLLFACLLSAVSAWAVGENNIIYYTSENKVVVWPKNDTGTIELKVGEGSEIFGANIVSNTYDDKQGMIVFDGKVNKIGSNAFKLTVLSSITIPNTVTSIGDLAFARCTKLSSVPIPESVTSIGSNAFTICTSLFSITIPESVTSIGNKAFRRSTSLSSITIEGTPTLGENAFEGVNDNITITVTNGNHEYIAYLNEYGIVDGKIKITNHVLEDGVDYAHSISYSENFAKITWKRTFAKDCWQALCLPFMLTEEEWSSVGTVAELTGAAKGVLEWTTLTGDTEAGKPYIIKPNMDALEDGVVNLELTEPTRQILGTSDWDEVISVTKDGYTVTGTYAEKTDMGDGKTYALYNGDFYFTNSNAKTLKPYRIFLTISTPTPMEAPIRINVVGSGIENPEGDGPTEIDGLVIEALDDAPAFNLHGQRVGADYKGIVIVNGRKVVRR